MGSFYKSVIDPNTGLQKIDPVTGKPMTEFDWGFAGQVGLTGVGTLLSAVGAYDSASAQKTQLTYQANIAASNAALANYQSQQTQVIADQQTAQQDMRTAQTFSSQRTSMAANGIDLSQGSANEVLASTKYTGAVNDMTIQDNATRQANVFNTEASNYSTESTMDTAASNSINPNMAAGSSLLTGAASLAKLFLA